MNMLKRESLANIFLVLSAILLLLGQVLSEWEYSYQNKLEQNLISSIDIQLKVVDVRLTMNEGLLRYLAGNTPEINDIAEELSLMTNREITREQVIENYFTPYNELVNYFLQVDSLNYMKPYWEDKNWESLLISFEIEKDKMKSIRWIKKAIYFLVFVCLLCGLYNHRKALKNS